MARPPWGTGPQCVPEELPRTQSLLRGIRWSSSPEGLVGEKGWGRTRHPKWGTIPSTVPNKWQGGL